MLSQTHQKRLEDMMSDIEDFVYDPNTTETHVIEVESYSLRKALSKRVTDVYMRTGVFAEFNRQSPEMVIKKSKSFKQVNFLRNVNPMPENFEESMDKVPMGLGFHKDVESETSTVTEFNANGKNTAATISDPSQFGFCADELKIEHGKVKLSEDLK